MATSLSAPAIANMSAALLIAATHNSRHHGGSEVLGRMVAAIMPSRTRENEQPLEANQRGVGAKISLP